MAHAGGGTGRREVVEHFTAVATVALDDQDNVVLVYPVPASGRPAPVGTAGGADRHAGEDPTLAAARELSRRAGLTAAHWSVLVDVVSSRGSVTRRAGIPRDRSTDVGQPAGHDERGRPVGTTPAAGRAMQMVYRGEIVNSLAVAGIPGRRRRQRAGSRRAQSTPWAGPTGTVPPATGRAGNG